jgi:hypothetical protein
MTRRAFPIVVATVCLLTGCGINGLKGTGSSPSSTGWSAVGLTPLPAPSSSSRTSSAPAPTSTAPATPWASTSLPASGASTTVQGASAFPVPGDVDGRSADAVAIGGAAAVASVDTAVDADPNSPAVRAARAGWFTAAYAKANIEAGPLPGPPGVQWNEWVAHRAFARVSARLGGDDHPPDGASVAARQVQVTQTPIGRDGWRGAQVVTFEAVVLRMTTKGWRIDAIQPS